MYLFESLLSIILGMYPEVDTDFISPLIDVVRLQLRTHSSDPVGVPTWCP